MTEGDTIKRDEAARLNRDALSRVMEETGCCIAAHDFNSWRPVRRTRGAIPGMPVAVVCVATDGNLGLFVPVYTDGHNLGSSFFGHVHRFEWSGGEDAELKQGAPLILFSVKQDGEMKAKKAKPKKPSLKSILAEM